MTIQEDISNTTTPTDALTPLEQLQAKIQDARSEFARALKTEFKAMYDRANELYDDISEARFGDERLLKSLNKVLKGLDEVVESLSDGTDNDDA